MKTRITFNAIDMLPSLPSLPLLLGDDGYCFNDERHARTTGQWYKAVLESSNVVTLYYRNKDLSHQVAHRYVIALDWHRTDNRLTAYHPHQATLVKERIVRQRLLYMIKLINTSNI